jgi:hypothetical protein
MVHRQKVLADDGEAGRRQEVVDIGHAAGERILDRDHAEIGVAGFERLEAVLEGGLRHNLHGLAEDLQAGDMRIGAGFALEDHALCQETLLSCR